MLLRIVNSCMATNTKY